MKFNLFLNVILIVVMLLYSKRSFIDDMWIFYLIHYFFLFGNIFSFVRKKHRKLYLLFSPTLFSFFYLGISFTLGAYFIPLNMGWSGDLYPNYIKIDHLEWFSTFFFITDLILLASWRIITSKGIEKLKNQEEQFWPKFNQDQFLFFSFLFLALNFVQPVQLILGPMLYPFKMVLIIYITLMSITLGKKSKGVIYFIILAIMLATHYHSKREIILVVFIVFFLESLYNKFNIKFNFKMLLIAFGGLFVAVYLVLAASILRGYGNFKLDNKLEALVLVPEYVSKPYFMDSFVVNFELNQVLGNSMICMDFIQDGKLPLQFGGTYLKVLLAPIPRSIWKKKPEGLILKYTYTLNPKHIGTKQNMPVVHYAEGFANFYWFGIIPILLIMLLFEKMYWYIITRKEKKLFDWKLIFSIYVICILFQYLRGSGFDLFMLYALFPLPLIIVITLLPKNKIK